MSRKENYSHGSFPPHTARHEGAPAASQNNARVTKTTRRAPIQAREGCLENRLSFLDDLSDQKSAVTRAYLMVMDIKVE